MTESESAVAGVYTDDPLEKLYEAENRRLSATGSTLLRRMVRAKPKELGEDIVGEQAAARGEREGIAIRERVEKSVGDEAMGDGERRLDGQRAEFAGEIVDVDAGVAAKAEEPGFFELLHGAEPALLGERGFSEGGGVGEVIGEISSLGES